MSRFNNDAILGLRDVAWMCEQRRQRRLWREPQDRRGGCSEAILPDNSLVVVPHDVDPLVSMAMTLAVLQAWNKHLGQKIAQLQERRTA